MSKVLLSSPLSNLTHTTAVAFLCLAFLGTSSAHGGEQRTKGFALSRFVPAFYVGDNECPEGLVEGPDEVSILAKLPAAERNRLKRPENYTELQAVIRHRAQPYGSGVCTTPEAFSDPGFRTVQGKVALGLNLDDAEGNVVAPHTCAHENFDGPSGEGGIDNQLYRALGCIKGQRPEGISYELLNAYMRQGDFTILIELRGVDDERNDDSVEVGFYSSLNPLAANVEGVVLTNASLTVHPDRHYQSVARGQIVNGVLTTQPVNIRFEAINANHLPEYYFRDARLRLELKADGTAHGILGAYEEVKTAFLRVATFGEETVHGPLQCPGLHYALQRLADGYRNRNGACTWISSAYEVEAVPAFVIHPRSDRALSANAVESDAWWKRLFSLR